VGGRDELSGGVGASPAWRTLIEHWDGTTWSIVPNPSPATGMTTQIGRVPDGVSQALNCGIDKARFLAPVVAGKRIRAPAVLASAEKNPANTSG
jgi:hypothetical protein